MGYPIPYPNQPMLPPACLQTSPVLAGLDDRHPYVRRTAVMGVLKIHHIDPNVVANMGEDSSAAPVRGCMSHVSLATAALS
jgi:hypothetical protein